MNTAKKLLILGGDKFAYRRLWLHTIHVATTGNDTTGNGSLTAPYLTLTKAMTVAVAGDGILVADGVYAEGDIGSYWTISKNLADWLTIEPELGAAGSVKITGNGHSTYNVYFSDTQSHLRLKWLTFGMTASSTQLMRITGTVSYLDFENCTFTPVDGCLYDVFITAVVSTNITFNNCTMNAPSTNNCSAVRISPSSGSSITLSRCTLNGSANFNTQSTGLYVAGNPLDASITVNNCNLSGGFGASVITGGIVAFSDCTFTSNEVMVGVDGTGDQAAATVTATFKNCTINKTGTTGHALLFGNGCTGCVADNVTITSSYDYALVLKEHTGTEVKNCRLTGGSSSALLYKAAISPNAHDNVLVGTGLAGAFQLRNGDDSSHKCATWIFKNNIVNVTSGKALQIGNSDHDSGGGICDYNTYQNNSGLGVVRNDVDVQSLAELQTAWSDYDVTTNDAHSSIK